MGALDGHKVGLIGLGLMGKPMARNLAAAGAQMTVASRSPGPVEELAAEGMTAAADGRAVAAASDIVIVMVTNTPSAEAVIAGPDGVIEGLSPGKLVIDMGTTAVKATRALADKVLAAGCDWIDAPVSGGSVGATDGTLTIMAGGAEEAIARAAPLFEVLGRRHTRIGGPGSGQVAKAINQNIVGLTIAAVAEGMALARKAGADPARVREALNVEGGFAQSRILDLHGQRMIDGDFAPGGRVSVQHKDVHQGLELAEQVGIRLPSLERNVELWDKMIEKGWADLDHAALIKLIEEQ
ncbi:MAG: NAD(P)-dependent oxidoreductase [Alphaproteobacteria bacterium]|nr:NAD(P)-dependent oxidoreductase [Alphaproteobacteria bacterium]